MPKQKTREQLYRDLMRGRCRAALDRIAVARGLAEEGARLARDRAGAGRVMDEIGSVLAGVEREMNGWFGYGE